jgi:hypothetical protein
MEGVPARYGRWRTHLSKLHTELAVATSSVWQCEVLFLNYILIMLRIRCSNIRRCELLAICIICQRAY